MTVPFSGVKSNPNSLKPADFKATLSENARLLTDTRMRQRFDMDAGIAPRGDLQAIHFTRFRKDELPEMYDRRYNDVANVLQVVPSHPTQRNNDRLTVIFSRNKAVSKGMDGNVDVKL
jgi:hypothetical protein